MDRTEEIRKMIQKEIQSISSLEERVLFKALMEGVFLSLAETNCLLHNRRGQSWSDHDNDRPGGSDYLL